MLSANTLEPRLGNYLGSFTWRDKSSWYPIAVSLMYFVIGNVKILMNLTDLFEKCSKYLQPGLHLTSQR